jgi:protein TonB
VPDPSVKADPKPAEPLPPATTPATATAPAPGSTPTQSKAAATEASSAAQTASAADPAQQAANATYKGKVWRHLQRFKGEALAGSGAAMVSFALEIHGRLTQLSLVQSSGSSRFDGEALQMVRRAQPFPPPPPEVQPSFLFEIQGQ